MRLLLFGSGSFGLPAFASLAAHHEIAAVVSQPDKPAGRKRQLTPTPVAAWALEQNLELHRSENVNTDAFVKMMHDYQADASVVIAFGQKLSPRLIEAMGKLAINLHASLLPKYRGAAPINWAMIEGETVAGVSVIALAQKMDAGDVYAEATLTIDPCETAGELHDRLADLGPAVVGRVLNDLEQNTLEPRPQDHDRATLAPKLKKSDGTVDFNQPAAAVCARVHGLTPWPGCRVNWHNPETGRTEVLGLRRVQPHLGETTNAAPGTVLENLRIACAAGTVELLEVQPPGKPTMPARDFARGHPFGAGQMLASLNA